MIPTPWQPSSLGCQQSVEFGGYFSIRYLKSAKYLAWVHVIVTDHLQALQKLIFGFCATPLAPNEGPEARFSWPIAKFVN